MPKRDTNGGGRRRVRTDGEALSATVPMTSVQTIKLGRMSILIMLDLIAEYQRTCAPIPLLVRDQIIAKHSKSPSAVIMSQLREKGALVSGAGAGRDRDVVPRFDNINYYDSSAKRVAWPPAHECHPLRTIPDVDESVEENQAELQPVNENASNATDVATKTLRSLKDLDLHQSQIASGAFVVSAQSTPIKLSPHRTTIYIHLMQYSRQHDYALLSPSELTRLGEEAGMKNPDNLSNYFDADFGLLVRVSGRVLSRRDPCMRALVFAPYVDFSGEVVVPVECQSFHSSASENVTHETEEIPQREPTSETVETHDVNPIPVNTQLRTKQELEAEQMILQDLLEVKRVERDQAFGKRELEREKLENWIQELEAGLQEARREFERFSNTPDMTVTLTSEIDVISAKAQKLAELIDNYDTLVALLCKS